MIQSKDLQIILKKLIELRYKNSRESKQIAMEFPLKLQPSPIQIFSPPNVAIFASLGLHSIVLGFFLPNFLGGSNSNLNSNKQNIGVIELNDAEQSRLPDSSPFSNSAPFPTGTTALPNNALPNNSFSTNPNINLPNISQPPLPNNNYSSTLPTQIPLPPLPALPSYPPNLPPLSSYNDINSLPISRSPVSLPPLRSSSSPSIRPSLPSLPDTQSYFRSVEGKATSRPNFGTLPPSRGTDFITTAPQNGIGIPQPELQADGQETTSEQAMRNDLAWRAKQANQQEATSNNIGVVTLTGAYPRLACRTKAEARVVYNVDPSGEITPIQTSRYSVFNELARQSFQSQRFNQPTRVIVDFKYDSKACASAIGIPNVPTETPPRLPSLNDNPLETVSPVNDPTRKIQQLPPLIPGSNSPAGAVEENTIQKAPSVTPSRFPSPSSLPTPTQGQTTPGSDSLPASVIKTSPNIAPTTPIKSTEYGPSPLGTKNSPAELNSEKKPEIKPTTENEAPTQTNSATPIKPQPDVTNSPATVKNQPETKRSRLQQMINQTPSSELNNRMIGPPLPTTENNPVGPSPGKNNN